MSSATLFAAVPRFRIPLGAVATFLAATLFLSGAVHICTIFLIPTVAESDGWSRLAAFAGEDEFTEVRTPVRRPGASSVNTTEAIAGLDPLFVTGACRVNLSGAPVGITVDARDRFWSLALYDRKGTIVFSLNDRTAADGRLDLLVVTPAQNAELKKNPPPNIEQTIVVESQATDLIALLRLFAPTPAAQGTARPTLAASECLPAPLEGGA